MKFNNIKNKINKKNKKHFSVFPVDLDSRGNVSDQTYVADLSAA